MSPVAELTEAQRVVMLNPNDLPKLWAQLQPFVEKACEFSHGQFDPPSVVDGVMDGSFQLLAYISDAEILSIAVLTVTQFRTGKRICEVLLASGSGLRDWVAFEPQVEERAKTMGCSGFRMIGRKGLAQMLPHWRQDAIVLSREFD